MIARITLKPARICLAFLSVILAAPLAPAQQPGRDTALYPGPAIYYVEIVGDLGWDVPYSNFTAFFRDVDRTMFDVVDAPQNDGKISTMVDPGVWTAHALIISLDSGSHESATGRRPADSLLMYTREIEMQLEERNRRIVFWVRRADDMAALMALSSAEVYFHPDATMRITESYADRILRRGARRLEGQPPTLLRQVRDRLERSGYSHADVVIAAMGDPEAPLTIRESSGGIEAMNREPTPEEEAQGWVSVQRADPAGEPIVLDAELAERLAISQGRCKTMEELIEAIGLPPKSLIQRGRGAQFFESWLRTRDGMLDRAERALTTEWVAYEKVEAEGEPYEVIAVRREMYSKLTTASLTLSMYKDIANHPRVKGMRELLPAKMALVRERAKEAGQPLSERNRQ